MTRTCRLAALHLRHDGPIPEIRRRRAAYPTASEFEAARARGMAGHYTCQIIVTARLMLRALLAGRTDGAALGTPQFIGLAGDLSAYVRARRSWRKRAIRP